MGVTVRVNFAPLADFPLSTKEIMREVGLLARERIIRRTAAGMDQADHAFAPYSPSYALQKGKELGFGGVNLQVSGAMLNAIVVTKVTDKSVTLEFSS